jgi:putative pre-16S rRNA nuclease
MSAATSSLLALDVGAKRIGVAIAGADVRFARPLTTLEHAPDIFAKITTLVAEHNAVTLVVGLPRGLDGQATPQTQSVEAFVDELRGHIQLPIVWQDEALTSVKAEAELASRKNKQNAYNKADVDALAATYILEDFIAEHPKELK